MALGDRRDRQRDRLRDHDGGRAHPEGASASQPRRTIRVALWSGEEEGLLGSLAYVKEHFGTRREPEAGVREVRRRTSTSTTGTGRAARRVGVRTAGSGRDPARDPRAVRGSAASSARIATTSRAIGGTDSTSFNNAGLPGIGFGQDSIEYGSHTHHTNLDTYERIIEEDVRDDAIVIAATLYQLAMRDEMLPRFVERRDARGAATRRRTVVGGPVGAKSTTARITIPCRN